jgi:hypothetical protein
VSKTGNGIFAAAMFLTLSISIRAIAQTPHNVVTNPTSSQNIVQPSNTNFSANNYAGIRYVTSSYNWSQSPTSPATLTGGTSATVTLTPCPLGIDTVSPSSAPYSVYVSGTGTAEAVTVTGGSVCTGGSATLTFTPAGSHAAGYTVQSASGGIQEAINDAGTPNSQVIIPPTGAASEIPIYAPVYVDKNNIEVSGFGAVVKCNTRSKCFHLGDETSAIDWNDVRLRGLKFDPASNIDGAQIANIAIASGTLTVTTATAHNFVPGDKVWAEFYSNTQAFHGLLTVLTATSTTYTATLGSGTVASVAAFGWTALENAAIEDNAQDSIIDDVLPAGPYIGGNPIFHFFVVVDNDQNAALMHLHANASGTRCTSNFCGEFVLGRSDNRNSSIIYIDKSDLSLNCLGNGVIQLSGNSLHILDSVIEGYNQFGVRYEAGVQNEFLTNVYSEVGICTNPMYPGGTLSAQAGVLHLGQSLFLRGGSEATSGAGNLPMFAHTGPGQRNYYIVPHSSVFGYGPILLAGYAQTSGTGTVNVYWPQVTGVASGTVKYDVLLTTSSFATPFTAPYPGNAQSLITGITGSCSNGICTYADTQGSTTSYSVTPQQYQLGVYFWPGGVVDGTLIDSNAGVSNMVYSDAALPNPVSTVSNSVPTFISQSCTGTEPFSPLMQVCLAGNNNFDAFISTLLTQTDSPGNGPTTNSKGRLIFEGRGDGSPIVGPNHIVTLADSNPQKTFATGGHRPSNDTNDAYIGFDHSSNPGASGVQLSFGAPLSISNYIANVGDGTNWKERLTATIKTFSVPIQTVPTTLSALPVCNSSSEGAMRSINNSGTNTWGMTITTTGSNHVLAYCDGSNWTVAAQ